MAPSPARWLICVLLLLATTLNYLDRVALNQLINPIMKEFGMTDREYGTLESAFAIAFGVGTLVTGFIVDIVNVRWVYPIVVLGWSAAGLLTGYSTTFGMLLACRVMLGLFEAGNWPCGIRTTRTVLPPEERSFGNALFQSGTAIGAILTPQVILLCFDYYGANTPGVWAVPFRIIGLIGGVWVALWLLLARPHMFPPPTKVESNQRFMSVINDNRFWILVAVIIGVNSGWHSVRVWMPRLLKVTYHYDDVAIQDFGTMYYLAADIGSWTVGLLTLAAAGTFGLLRVRVISFVVCTVLLVAASTTLIGSSSTVFKTGALLVVGFAGLGLFPTYFAMSQDLSSRHQGKVTGLLGFINALWLAGMINVQKEIAARDADYAILIATSVIPAIIAAVLVVIFWRTPNA